MKYVYQITYLLFAIDSIGRLVWKDFFLSHQTVVYWFVLVESAVISFSLIHSILTCLNSPDYCHKKDTHIGFLTLIFSCSLIFPAAVAFSMLEPIKVMEDPRKNDLSLAAAIYSAKDEAHGKKLAEMTYRNTGLALPYSNDQGQFIMFSPSEEDLKRHVKSSLHVKEMVDVRNYLLNISRENLALLIVKIGVFLLMLIIMVLIQRTRLVKTPF